MSSYPLCCIATNEEQKRRALVWGLIINGFQFLEGLSTVGRLKVVIHCFAIKVAPFVSFADNITYGITLAYRCIVKECKDR
jgi:hypothetical protein